VARLQPPDLVLLDVIMPGMDGFEACRQLKHDELTRHIPVILLTALNDLDHKVEGTQAGADDFVSKPFDRIELLLRVKAMLRIKALHDQLNQKIEELEGARIRLRRLADTDPLTSLYNQRYLRKNLAKELERAKRFDHPLSVIMLDLDRFKEINDTWGHPAGDAILQQLGALFMQSVRRIDFATRYGGEEFVIVLPETDLSGAMVVTRRLRDRVERHRFLDPDGQPLDRVTISAGVAIYPEGGIDCESLIETADRRLYAAKEAGRNRIVFQNAVSA
jgi:diguanylate cyclase (GGDEF)-like protein